MMTVPIPRTAPCCRRGRTPGACRSRKTDPTATFMPSVFMISASHIDTSRTRPVALRVKLKSCDAPVAGAGTDVIRITSCALAPAVAGAGGNGPCIGGGTDDMPELAAHAVALQREPEPVGPVQHARHLGRAVILIERGALDPERRGPRGQLQQARFVVPNLDDLDRAQRAAHLHAVQALQRRVERNLREVLRREVGEAGRIQPRGQQGQRAARDGRQPVQPEQTPGPAAEDLADLWRRRPGLRAGHGEHRSQALAAQRVGEAPEQVDLLDYLVVADEGALAPDPQQVPLAHQLEQGLADRREADPEVLRVLALVRDLLARAQGAALDLVLQPVPELVMQRHR